MLLLQYINTKIFVMSIHGDWEIWQGPKTSVLVELIQSSWKRDLSNR